jgi:hypothetical protein
MKYLKITALLVFILPSLALAAGPQVTEPGFLDSLICVKDVKNCQLTDVAAGFNSLIKLLLGGMGAVALLYFVIGGFKWVTSRGNQQQVRDGQQMMVNTVFALVIAFTSYLVLSFFVNDVLQVDTDYKISGTQSTNPGDSTGECVGQEIGTPCSTSSVNYVCSGPEFEDQCVTKCMLKNIVDKEILIENDLNWQCGNIASFPATPPVWHESNLCPESTSKDCIIFWNGLPVTDDRIPPIYEE